MTRAHLLLGSLLSLLLAGAFAITVLDRPRDQGPVYSVAQVQAGLARHPRTWTTRMLLVRGVADATGCSLERADTKLLCATPRFVLRDADPAATGAPLRLAWVGSDPLPAFVRRLPLLGSLVPAGQTVQWNMVATYRVKLRTVFGDPCDTATCFEAVVLDVAPPGDL